jgi:type I restriction enzyme S subunit
MRSGWTKTTLGEIANYINGYPFKPGDLGDHGIPVIRIKQLLNSSEQVDRTTIEVPERCVLKNGDIIFSWSGTLAVRVWDRGHAYLNQHLFRVEEHSGVNHNWLPLVLDHAIDDLLEKSHGTTMKHITKQTLLPHEVLLPPLAEQMRIVDVISSVDEYIVGLEQQILSVLQAKSALLEEQLQGDFVGAKQVKLGDVLEISRGGSPRPIQAFLTDSDDGLNWIKIGDATNSTKYIYDTKQKIKREGLTKTRQVFPGDFLLSNSMSFGRPYIMRTDGCIHDGWLLLGNVSKHFDEDFLYNLLRSSSIQAKFASQAAGSGVKNLNIDIVSDVEITLPSISDQERISKLLNSFDAHELALEDALSKATYMRKAVLNDLLSGNHEIPESYDSFLEAV